MATNPESPDTSVAIFQGATVWLIAAVLLTTAIVLHGLLPRYEFATVGADRGSIVVFDRWTGQFQRVDYGADGEPRATSVVSPF